MKTRHKIIIISIIAVVSFFVWSIPYNVLCNVFDNYDSCHSVHEINIPRIGMLQYDNTLGMTYPLEPNCEETCSDDHLSDTPLESIKTEFENTSQELSMSPEPLQSISNPDECWYLDDDGNMSPCKIRGIGFPTIIVLALYVFWPYIILGVTIVVIFVVWRKRKRKLDSR